MCLCLVILKLEYVGIKWLLKPQVAILRNCRFNISSFGRCPCSLMAHFGVRPFNCCIAYVLVENPYRLLTHTLWSPKLHWVPFLCVS